MFRISVMIPYQNYEVAVSFLFFILSKLLCSIINWYRISMYNKRQALLQAIPEKNENEEQKINKWVPKKKHEVLKAKYKCLKKLFQIYDASVIGILPDPYNEVAVQERLDVEDRRTRRKKRSHRTKTDACAGTTETGDEGTEHSEIDRSSTIATAVIRDLKIQCSCSTQMISEISKSDEKSSSTQDSKENISQSETNEHECNFTQTTEPMRQIPYLMVNEKRKFTRFQSFIQRIFGIRSEKSQTNYLLPAGHVYASSDNNIAHRYSDKRRRRGLRLRRVKKAKKTHSESALRDPRSPAILSCVQSVQRSCLMDTTPRQCPIMGCRMMFYGIINYNDHLNLCHFVERKHICHYCHEGFQTEYEKYLHENEHIGINRLTLGTNVHDFSAGSTLRQSTKKASNTQTDPEVRSGVPEDKLKKIVSFFDKIVDTEQMLNEMNKNHYSESNLQTMQRSSKTECASETATDNSTDTNSTSDKRAGSCGDLHKNIDKSKSTMFHSEVTSKCPCVPVKCHICGENFDYRRQLSLHVDLEHRVHDKFSKFHSCAGITNPTRLDMVSKAGKIKVRSSRNDIRRVNTTSTFNQDSNSEISRRKSDETLSYDPSTNIIFYESFDTMKKPSVIDNIVEKVRSGIASYRWEPGTKIIRV